MKKRVIAIIGTVVLCFCVAASVYATPYDGYGCRGGCSLMWDEDGNFLDQSAFEENLDGLTESGIIRAEDRDFFLERYEWCRTNGGGSIGVRGGCGGRGMGFRIYR